MVNDKLIAIDEETRKDLESYKIHPREPVGDVVKKLLGEYKELKERDRWEGLTPQEQEDEKIARGITNPTPDLNTTDSTPGQPLTE